MEHQVYKYYDVYHMKSSQGFGFFSHFTWDFKYSGNKQSTKRDVTKKPTYSNVTSTPGILCLLLTRFINWRFVFYLVGTDTKKAITDLIDDVIKWCFKVDIIDYTTTWPQNNVPWTYILLFSIIINLQAHLEAGQGRDIDKRKKLSCYFLNNSFKQVNNGL